MNNKKKNSTKDHTLSNVNFVNDIKKDYGNNTQLETLKDLVDSLIYDYNNQTINGLSIVEIEKRLYSSPHLPKGMKAACHICKPTQYFKTFDDLMIHSEKWHDYRKRIQIG